MSSLQTPLVRTHHPSSDPSMHLTLHLPLNKLSSYSSPPSSSSSSFSLPPPSSSISFPQPPLPAASSACATHSSHHRSSHEHGVRSHPVRAFLVQQQQQQEQVKFKQPACVPLSSSSCFSSSLSSATSSCMSCHPRRSFWNLKCSCLFSLLPDEIMLFNIFSMFQAEEIVNSLSLVSTRWNFLAADRFLWTDLDLSKHASRMNDSTLMSLAGKYGSHLESLKLCQCQSLTVSGSLLQFADVTPMLRQLHLCNLFNVTDDVVMKFSNLCPDLSSVSLFGCKLITDRAVQTLTENCTELIDLSLRGCVKITDAAFIHLHNTKLIELNISSCKLITAVGLTTIANATRHTLQRLNAHGVTLSDAAILAFTTTVLPTPSSPTPSLSSLSASPPSSSLSLPPASLSSSVSSLDEESSLSLPSPSSSRPSFSSSPSSIVRVRVPLSTLHLSSSNPFGGNVRVTDASIRTLGTLDSLTCLNLQGSSNITDDAMHAALPHLPLLQRFNLGGVYRLTDRTLHLLARHNRRLTHLSLFQLFHITDDAVIALLRALPHIVHLDLHSCGGLTSSLLRQLATPVSSSAASFESESSDQVIALDDDVPVKVLPPSSSSLSSSLSAQLIAQTLLTLDLGSIRSIKADDVAALKGARPNLNIVHY